MAEINVQETLRAWIGKLDDLFDADEPLGAVRVLGLANDLQTLLTQLTKLERDHEEQRIVNYPHDITTRWLGHISDIKHSARATGKTSPIHNLTSVESILKWWEEEIRPGLIHGEDNDG